MARSLRRRAEIRTYEVIGGYLREVCGMLAHVGPPSLRPSWIIRQRQRLRLPLAGQCRSAGGGGYAPKETDC